MQYVYQMTQNLMLISNPLKKLQKDLCKQIISEKVAKNRLFDFNYFVQKFSAYNFIWVNLFTFFQQIWTHIFWLILAFY